MRKTSMFVFFSLVVCLAVGLSGVASPQKGKKGGGGGQKSGGDVEMIAVFEVSSSPDGDEFREVGPTQYVHGQGARILILGGGRSKGNLTFRVGGREKGGGLSRDFFLSFANCLTSPCNPPFSQSSFVGDDDLWADFHTSGKDLLELLNGSVSVPADKIDAHLSFQEEASGTINGWLLHWATPLSNCSFTEQADFSYDAGTKTFVIATDATPAACLHGWGGGQTQGTFGTSFRMTLTPKP